MSFTLGIILAIVSMLGYGVSNIFSRKVMEKIDAYSTLVITQSIGLVIIIIISVIFGFFKLPSTESIKWIILGGIIGAYAIYMLFKGIEKYQVSIVVPVAQTYPLIAIILSVIIFKELIKVHQYIAGIIIVLGVIMLSIDKNELKTNHKGVSFGLLTSIGWGFYAIMIGFITQTNDVFVSSIFSEIGVFIFLIIPAILGVKKITLPPKNMIKMTLLSSTALTLGIIGFVGSINFAPISIVSPITSSAVLITVIAARIFLKEKINNSQKIAIGLIIAGIIMSTL